jgi:glucose/arabinose dehydrogenase
MHPHRPVALSALARACLITAVVALAAACGPGGGAAPPAASAVPSASPTARPGGSDGPSVTSAPPTASPTPFDPAAASFALELVAEIPGRPLAVVNAGDGTGRLFVAEQGGRVLVVQGGSVSERPFLDVTSRTAAGGERGLLGLAFHPRYPDDPRVFVNYTDLEGDTVVSSFTVDPDDPASVDRASEVVVLQIDQPFANHNGGAIVFGPDGMLYVATGDGGSGGDPHDNGQRLDTLLGKILRLDVDRTENGRAYGIPADNPFVGRGNARAEIWLYGLRNPFRISFDRATGDLWMGDVGQGAYEEIDVARAASGGGTNFGWARMEGFHCFPSGEGCARPELALPVAEYGHDRGCAVTGGVVYRGSTVPSLVGGYVFADYCSGFMWVLDAAATDPREPRLVVESGRRLAGFGEDEAGELYVADLDGALLRVVATR